MVDEIFSPFHYTSQLHSNKKVKEALCGIGGATKTAVFSRK